MVSYTLDTLPPVNQKALDRAAAIKEKDIDYSDIPDLAGIKLRPRPAVDRNVQTGKSSSHMQTGRRHSGMA